MGQIGSYIRRRDDNHKPYDDSSSGSHVSRTKARDAISSLGIHDLLSTRIPDAFLIHQSKSNQFVDEDGDVANEFYLEEKEGPHRTLRRTTSNLKPQKIERYRIPRLHPDVPVVMVQVKS